MSKDHLQMNAGLMAKLPKVSGGVVMERESMLKKSMNSVMRVALVGVMALVFGMAGFVSNADAVVSRVGNWSTPTDNTNPTPVSVGAGSDRVLLIVVVNENTGTVTTPTAVTYGGQAVQNITSAAFGDTGVYNNASWIGYCDETCISNAVDTNIDVAVAGITDLVISAATFEGVNQATPIADFANDGLQSDAAEVGFINFTNPAGGQTIFSVQFNAGTVNTNTSTPPTGFTEIYDKVTAGNTGYTTALSERTVTTSGTFDILITPDNTAADLSNRTTLVAVSLNPVPACVPANPTVTISTAAQEITTDGGTAGYSFTITNNDSAACSNRAFALSVANSAVTNFDASTLSTGTTGNLAPAATSSTFTMTANATAGQSTGTVTGTITASQGGDSGTDNVTTTLNVPVCVPAAPTVTITEASQEITTDGGTALYNYTVTNNDSAVCSARAFALSVADSAVTNFDATTLPDSTTGAIASNGGTFAGTVTANATAGTYVGSVTSTITVAEGGDSGNDAVTTTSNVPCVPTAAISWNATTAANGDFNGSTLINQTDITPGSLQFRVTSGSGGGAPFEELEYFDDADTLCDWTNWTPSNPNTDCGTAADHANDGVMYTYTSGVTGSGGTLTNSGNTGPTSLDSGTSPPGGFFWVEASGAPYTTPNTFLTRNASFDADAYEPNISFASSNYGTGTGTIVFEVSTDGGTNYTTEWQQVGDDTNAGGWIAVDINLLAGTVSIDGGGSEVTSTYGGSDTAYTSGTLDFRFRFFGVTAFAGDAAIDTIRAYGPARSVETEHLAWNADAQEMAAVLPVLTGGKYNVYARGTDNTCGTGYVYGGAIANPGTSKEIDWTSCSSTCTVSPVSVSDPITGDITITVTAVGADCGAATWSPDGGSNWYASGSTYSPTMCLDNVPITFDAQAVDTKCGGFFTATPFAPNIDTLDTIADNLQITVPAANGSTVSGNVTLTATASEAMNNMTVTVTGTSGCNVAAQPMLGSGPYTYSWGTTTCGDPAENPITITVNGDEPQCGGAKQAQRTNITVDNTAVDTTSAGTATATPETSKIVVRIVYTDDDNNTSNALVEWDLEGGSWSGGNYGSQALANDTSPYSYIITGLTNDQPYQVRVTLYDTDGVTTATGWTVNSPTEIEQIFNDVTPINKLLHNSATTGSAYQGGNWGLAGQTYGEFTCTTCHSNNGTTNIKRIRETINATGAINGRAVTYADATANNSDVASDPADMGDDGDARGAAVSERVCEVCHTQTQYHRATTNDPTPDLTHNNRTDCIACHKHTNAFKASCDSCHGNPPGGAADTDGLVFDPQATGSLSNGAHEWHVADLAFDCSVCHGSTYGGGARHTQDMAITMDFNAFGDTDGVYDGQVIGTVPAGYENGSGASQPATGALTCASVYCHGDSIGGSTPAWDGTISCGDCHANPYLGGSHTRHAGTLGLGCNQCHGSTPASGADGHVNGQVSWNVTALSGSSPTYNGAVNGTGGAAPTAYETCTNIYCHSNVQNATGTAAATAYASPNWGGSVACGDCHGAAVTGRPTSGSHSAHGQACSTCHTGAGDETAVHVDGEIDVDIDNTYGGTAVYSQLGANTPGNGYGDCSNVSCHGAGTPTWGSSVSCSSCHGQGANVPWPNVGAHNAHFVALGIASLTDAQAPAKCNYCHTGHGSGTGTHADGAIDDVVIATTTPNFNDQSAGTPAYTTGATGTCSNVSCHGGQTTPAWNTTINSDTACASCHVAEASASEYNSATTQLHSVTSTAISNYNHVGTDGCLGCHSGQPATHFGTSLETQALDTVISADLASGVSAASCAVACHLDGGAWSRLNNANYATASNGDECRTCHGNFATVWVTGVAPSHTNNWDGDGNNAEIEPNHLVCKQCHVYDDAAYGALGWDPNSASNHGDGVITMNGTVGSAYVGTERGCATICHDGNTGGDTHQLAASAGGWTVGLIAGPGASCTSCHGYPPDTLGGANDKHAPGATAVDHSAAAITGSHSECNVCHGYSETNGATDNSGAGGDTYQASYHNDGNIEMNGVSATAAGQSTEYIESNFGCNAACHNPSNDVDHRLTDSGLNVQFGEYGGGDCDGCHDGSGAAGTATSIDATSPHTLVDTGLTCAECHGGHGTAGTIVIPNNSTVGINYTGNGETGIGLGAPTTAPGTTEAEICWNCHELAATDISEWGTNTGGTYNYGSVTDNDLNWTTTSWASAVFSYKDGALDTPPGGQASASIHATGGTPGTQNETLSDVRCSYCHDVHDTQGPTGKPYLRAAWRPSGYKEDGAPRSDATGSGVTYGNSVDYGAVPRGLGNYDLLGGWQIDQNNGNPNGTYTYATNDALCATCHTQADIQTDAPLHGNSVKGFNTGLGSNILRVGPTSAGGTGNTPRGGGDASITDGNPSTNNANPNMGYYYATSPGCEDEADGLREVDRDGFGIAPRIWYTTSSDCKDGVSDADQRYGWELADKTGNALLDLSQDTTTTDTNFHAFSCSKCHNPHASRLPRLMITNCLDVVNNTWDDTLNPEADSSSSNWANNTTNNNPAGIDQLAYVSSAQNCHRKTTVEEGWNSVTPW